jgi:hypothetical protein
VYARSTQDLAYRRAQDPSPVAAPWGAFLRLNGHFLWAIVKSGGTLLKPEWVGSLREGHIREHPPSVFLDMPVDEINDTLNCAIRDGYVFGTPPSAEVVSSVARSSLKREAAWRGTPVGPPDRSDKPVDPYDRIRYITSPEEGDDWTAWSGEGKLVLRLDGEGAKALYDERPSDEVKDVRGRTIGYRLEEVRTFP